MNTTIFRRPILTLTMVGLASGCTPLDDAKELPTPPAAANVVAAASSGGPTEPEPEPEVETVIVEVASVQLQDDCLPPADAAKRAAKPSEGARERPDPGRDVVEDDVARGDMPWEMEERLAARCIPSEVQLLITSKDSEALPFAIRAVRLRKGAGGEVGGPIETMKARMPGIWKGSTYVGWDESIAPGTAMNVRYSLGAPDWAAVEKILDGSSWGPLYVVEFEVEVGGRLRTISSPRTPRAAVEEMVT